LTYLNGKLKLRNSASARQEVIDALVERNGENMYYYPPGDQSFTAESLFELRDSNTGYAIEMALGNEKGCLSDKSRNDLKDGEGIAIFKKYDERVSPWTAVKIYVAKVRNDVNPCTGTQLGSQGTIKTTVDLPYYIGQTQYRYQADFEAREIYTYVDPGGQGIQVVGRSDSGDELYFILSGLLTVGTYPSAAGLADLAFTSPQIRNQDDNEMVEVRAESGGLHLDTFENAYGGRLAGYFSDVAIAGAQRTPDGTAIRVISGKLPRVDFDLLLAEPQPPPPLSAIGESGLK